MVDAEQAKSIHSEARQYAWSSFEYHAKQRMDVFRFYLIVVGLVFIGSFRLLEKGYELLALMSFAFLLLSSFVFHRLDVRGKDLVQISERHLKKEEKRMAEILSSDDIAIISNADLLSAEKKASGPWILRNSYSFSQLFSIIYGAVGVFASLAMLAIVCSSP